MELFNHPQTAAVVIALRCLRGEGIMWRGIGWRRRSGGVRFLRRNVSHRGVLGAIGLAAEGAGAAEVEVLLARLADRPRAARTRELDHDLPLWRPLERRRPGLERQAMRLADHGILGQADPPTDLGGGVPFLPQAAKLIDKMLSPHRFH